MPQNQKNSCIFRGVHNSCLNTQKSPAVFPDLCAARRLQSQLLLPSFHHQQQQKGKSPPNQIPTSTGLSDEARLAAERICGGSLYHYLTLALPPPIQWYLEAERFSPESVARVGVDLLVPGWDDDGGSEREGKKTTSTPNGLKERLYRDIINEHNSSPLYHACYENKKHPMIPLLYHQTTKSCSTTKTIQPPSAPAVFHSPTDSRPLMLSIMSAYWFKMLFLESACLGDESSRGGGALKRNSSREEDDVEDGGLFDWVFRRNKSKQQPRRVCLGPSGTSPSELLQLRMGCLHSLFFGLVRTSDPSRSSPHRCRGKDDDHHQEDAVDYCQSTPSWQFVAYLIDEERIFGY